MSPLVSEVRIQNLHESHLLTPYLTLTLYLVRGFIPGLESARDHIDNSKFEELLEFDNDNGKGAEAFSLQMVVTFFANMDDVLERAKTSLYVFPDSRVNFSLRPQGECLHACSFNLVFVLSPCPDRPIVSKVRLANISNIADILSEVKDISELSSRFDNLGKSASHMGFIKVQDSAEKIERLCQRHGEKALAEIQEILRELETDYHILRTILRKFYQSDNI
ncbi:hypothetical protein ABW20_dc0104153 [Dactylellina cionopaga]|nr:hypothetical protein ABW20_dc0104153 [Dactylellina cionopaga]